ncbi:hypothetical protein QUF72_14350 [Desulfobacterales bacterium HSG2]|nr:hypothetical protein [Desulfobacterales bacterium HSG2]
MSAMSHNSGSYTRGGCHGATYSSVVTIKLTLSEAMRKVISNEMSPKELFNQLPIEIQEEINKQCTSHYDREFNDLAISQQKDEIGALLSVIENPHNTTATHTIKLTFPQAIKKVINDEMSAKELFLQFPKELQATINKECKVSYGKKFNKLTINQQKKELRELLDETENIKQKSITSLTFKEAIKLASQGEIRPRNIFIKLDSKLKKRVNYISQLQFKKDFIYLTNEQQRTVFAKLFNDITSYEKAQREINILHKNIKEFENGIIEASALFNRFTFETRKLIDTYCSEVFGKNFIKLPLNRQKAVLLKLLNFNSEQGIGKSILKLIIYMAVFCVFLFGISKCGTDNILFLLY